MRFIFSFVLSITFSLPLIAKQTPKESLTVMTFNVENLFDTQHDEGKNDQTFLPLKEKQSKEHILSCGAMRQKAYQNDCVSINWDEKALDQKLQNISKVIRSVNDGKGPDILGLVEVENKRVLEKLRTSYLKDLNYQPSILIEGNDIRGIDVALMTKLPIQGEPVLHDIVFKKHRKKGTERGILETTLKLPNGDLLTVFVLHLLAPSNPYERRVFALEELNEKVSQLPPNRLAIALGDFNITKRENKKLSIIEKYIEPKWLVSQKIGCENCIGTHYMKSKKEWSFLDMILLSQNLKSTSKAKSNWQYVPDSVRVVKDLPEQTDDDHRPQAYDATSGKGVSDHYPLMLKIGKI